MASSRVSGPMALPSASQSSSPVSGRKGTTLSVTPRSRATACQGPTLAWWSSSVITISSPGAPPPAQRPGQVEGQGGHVRPERDLVRVGVEEVGQRAPGRLR